MPLRGVTLRVISPLRVGRHMAGQAERGGERGAAHNFQIYVQMFLAKRASGRFSRGEDIYRKVSRN